MSTTEEIFGERLREYNAPEVDVDYHVERILNETRGTFLQYVIWVGTSSTAVIGFLASCDEALVASCTVGFVSAISNLIRKLLVEKSRRVLQSAARTNLLGLVTAAGRCMRTAVWSEDEREIPDIILQAYASRSEET
jgi:hypothetical protein